MPGPKQKAVHFSTAHNFYGHTPPPKDQGWAGERDGLNSSNSKGTNSKGTSAKEKGKGQKDGNNHGARINKNNNWCRGSHSHYRACNNSRGLVANPNYNAYQCLSASSSPHARRACAKFIHKPITTHTNGVESHKLRGSLLKSNPLVTVFSSSASAYRYTTDTQSKVPPISLVTSLPPQKEKCLSRPIVAPYHTCSP